MYLYGGLALGVELVGGLVEQQDAGVADHGTGDGDALDDTQQEDMGGGWSARHDDFTRHTRLHFAHSSLRSW